MEQDLGEIVRTCHPNEEWSFIAVPQGLVGSEILFHPSENELKTILEKFNRNILDSAK
jgi:hypothetical protein